MLELTSFSRIERFLITAGRGGGTPDVDDEALARWTDAFLARGRGPWQWTCLRRSAVLYYLLRAAGREVDLCIGVRRDDGGALRAHAWLVRGDAVYLESERGHEHVNKFTVIARFPPQPPSSA